MKNTQTATSKMLEVNIGTDSYFFNQADFAKADIPVDQVMHTEEEFEAAILKVIKVKLGFSWRFLQ